MQKYLKFHYNETLGMNNLLFAEITLELSDIKV